MNPKSGVFLLFLFFNLPLFAQKTEAALTIHLLANEQIAEVNLDQDTFLKSFKAITEYCQQKFNGFPATQKAGVLITLHKTGPATYRLYSNPKLDAGTEAGILKELQAFPAGNTILVDFPLFIAINCTEGKEITDFADYKDPVKEKMEAYLQSDLAGKLRLNKEYAINEVLPVLAAFEAKVDEKFAGVKNLGKLIAATDFSKSQDVPLLTDKNKNYWRAVMEMNAGNQLIPATKIAALVAQGELDYAKKYLEVLRMYADPKAMASSYLEELNIRINTFQEDLNREIKKGITLHDQMKFAEAIKVYDQILSVYPNSAWALYEKYYSAHAQKSATEKQDRTDWDQAKIDIYKHNPLYNLDVRASNGREAWLMFRRQEIGSLFKKKEDRLKDFFAYADISADLGVYDFAAQLFWLVATFDKTNSQKAIHHYLYCLNKLGEKELKSNFKGDFDKIFAGIDAEKKNIMESSPVYQAFKE